MEGDERGRVEEGETVQEKRGGRFYGHKDDAVNTRGGANTGYIESQVTQDLI